LLINVTTSRVLVTELIYFLLMAVVALRLVLRHNNYFITNGQLVVARLFIFSTYKLSNHLATLNSLQIDKYKGCMWQTIHLN